jgi:hypothetical protein
MTADCLPILLWTADASQVAGVHAGWRGLANGVIKKCVALLGGSVRAFIGPGIGPCHYEVDDTVKAQFEAQEPFTESRVGHYWFDLSMEAERQLNEAGVSEVAKMSVCTACDDRFYSHRAEGETGRFASLIWLSPSSSRE